LGITLLDNSSINLNGKLCNHGEFLNLNNQTQCVARLTRNLVSRGFETPSKAPVVSLSKKRYPHCLVLVGFRNEFQPDFTIELM